MTVKPGMSGLHARTHYDICEVATCIQDGPPWVNVVLLVASVAIGVFIVYLITKLAGED